MVKTCKLLLAVSLACFLSGCGMRTVDQMYALPKRSQAYSNLQSAIDQAMIGLEYAAPAAGENQQTVQQADLNGDGMDEYLLFARGSSEKPLRVMIFSRSNERFELTATIENPGFSFEQVEYGDIDDQPGVELVVGSQVSDQLLRNVTVYGFAQQEPVQLMTANYSRFLTCDLDGNGLRELMLLQPGETEADRAIAVLYRYARGSMERSQEADLSESVDHVKRIMVSGLESGEQAVYVASSVEESAIVTDILALKRGQFTNISFSSEAQTSVQTLRNYYIYADDIDNDGVLELPSLIQPDGYDIHQPYLIRWFSMDLSGNETDKIHTYHNFTGGWYLELPGELAGEIYITQAANAYVFWHRQEADSKPLMSIYVLTGPNREDQALEEGRFVLHRGDGVLYAARLEPAGYALAWNQEEITNRFHLISHDWKTGET